jgi:nitrite reductase (NADH) large subunit
MMARDNPAQKPHLVVIGNGMAGCRAVEELLKRVPDAFDITIIGAEPRVNYNRIMLSPVLAGEKTFEDIIINDQAWYDANGISLIAGDAAEAINRSTKSIHCASGRIVSYDYLLLATGSDPFIIPVPGKDLIGVVTFRDLDDVTRMLDAASRGKNAVVIGGGLLGLEAAHGLAQRGMAVTVVHLMPTLMERQLDEAAGYLLSEELQRRGQKILVGANTKAILGDGHVQAVELADGTRLDADIVVMAVGIRPSATLAKSAGLATARGIQVDDHMVTSDPAIYAVGECVEHRGACYGLLAPLWDMCHAFADHASGLPGSGYQGSVTSTKLKVSGIDVFSTGDFSGGEGCEDIVLRDAARGVYKRVIVKDRQIAGAVLYGDTSDGNWYFQLLKDGTDIADMRDMLIFGQAFALGDNRQDPRAAVAALPASAEICGCNGVCKGTIVDAITKQSLTTLDDVRKITKASASCGSCTPLVENLLAATLGDDYRGERKAKPMCACTDFTHDEVRGLLIEKKLGTIPALMQSLHWKTPDGCASCRPALNYYMLCAWPGVYVDDKYSRFINERAHANIQKDGTYSVVPRMWGGLTTAKELRAIADVVDKFEIPTVKVTGGQRIDLLGVKKEDLPSVWMDLSNAGMVSGHAYAKALRTVKTCVGSEWCRFGTQDSTGLGVTLEQRSWGSWMPHKFKMAISGCPRNCAEATIKDFGIICVESGYELHVGGNGGIHVRVTDLLCKVATEADAIEYCEAFVQYYREDACYLERTAPWVKRLGIELLKSRIVDDAENRTALAARFRFSQQFFQTDPWEERAQGKDASEFRHMAHAMPLVSE